MPTENISSADLADESLDSADGSQQLYTPAMLAELLKVSVRSIRRWHRAGLLKPVDEVMQLPYFDYAALATAKQLSTWMRQGASVASIQQQLHAFRQRLDSHVDDQELIKQLPISADGKHLVLRQGERFIEASGQFRLEFDETHGSASIEVEPAVIRFERPHRRAPQVLFGNADASDSLDTLSLDEMVAEAIEAEDEDDFEVAVDWYRAALAAYGPNPDVCFQIAELLYRVGDLPGARERYFIALELNPELVEARANLGCVLAECGQPELAIAAFEGALQHYPDYADVHFHLARSLDDLGSTIQAAEHWHRFIELAPESPWAEEAREFLRQAAPMLEI